jgi:XisH protein
MPACDFDHDDVESALKADGWTITHNPWVLEWGFKDLFGCRDGAKTGHRAWRTGQPDRVAVALRQSAPWDY